MASGILNNNIIYLGRDAHPYFSFALALSLGFESSCEIMDFNITEELPFEKVRDGLNAVMPEGMRIVSVSEQKKKITAITSAEYEIELSSENNDRLVEKINELMASDSIFIEKKTKKGISEVDLKPSISGFRTERLENGNVFMVMRLPAGTQTNYNPTLFLEALKKRDCIPFETEKISRTGIFCENNEIFS